jgi:type IV/VI secretion system ImpK/VasF family protein
LRSQVPDYTALRDRVRALLAKTAAKARGRGFSSAEIDDATFAVAAYVDEMVQLSQWAGRLHWSVNTLAKELFNERAAGNEFFERLHRVRDRSRPALEVYYNCLLLGFHGRYRVGEATELIRLVETVGKELSPTPGGNISVHGKREDNVGSPARRFPVLAIAGATIGMALGVAIVLFLLLDSTRQQTVELLGSLGGR